MTVAERDELLDAVERVDRVVDDRTARGADLPITPVVLALADLVARAVRILVLEARPADGTLPRRPPDPP